MRNIKLVVAYEGTRYHGFQDQGAGLPTIQAALEAGISRITREAPRLTGAGRTDAGVHAFGQVVNFRTKSQIPIERWPYALNSVIPRDIVVQEASEESLRFHSRYGAVAKTYRYTLDNACFPNVYWRRFAYHVRDRIDVETMQQAATFLIGEHDFASFQATGSSAKTSTRTVQAVDVSREGSLIHLTVSANGFLYHMVRIIAGTLLEVGRGKRCVDWVLEVLNAQNRGKAGPTAPALGLCLLAVEYKKDKELNAGQYNLDNNTGLH